MELLKKHGWALIRVWALNRDNTVLCISNGISNYINAIYKVDCVKIPSKALGMYHKNGFHFHPSVMNDSLSKLKKKNKRLFFLLQI